MDCRPDVSRFRATVELFSQLDDRFGGGHARQAFMQYLRGVLFVAVLHFIPGPDASDAATGYLSATASGGALVLSHGTSDAEVDHQARLTGGWPRRLVQTGRAGQLRRSGWAGRSGRVAQYEFSVQHDVARLLGRH